MRYHTSFLSTKFTASRRDEGERCSLAAFGYMESADYIVINNNNGNDGTSNSANHGDDANDNDDCDIASGASDDDDNMVVDDAGKDGANDDSMSDDNSEDDDEDHAKLGDVDWWENIDEEDLEEIEEVIDLFEGIFGKEMLDKHSFSELFCDDKDDDTWEILDALRILLKEKKKRRQKHHLPRKDTDRQSYNLLASKLFDVRFRMPKEHFDYLVDALRSDITVDPTKSMNSTRGVVEPISAELVARCGIDRIAHGASELVLQDLYGISLSSTKRVIELFLNAVDSNTTCPELQVHLPDPTIIAELDDMAKRWSNTSTAHRLFDGFLGALDGWLPRTEKPRGVTNQTDYFSGHYQCFGLNVQAMCDPDLVFTYYAVAAPGKVNDIRAFRRCDGLQQWIQQLPEQYYIGADNAYPLSRKILIPFSGPELDSEARRAYNFYLSQLRIRIEMAFGRLTTKWRILRTMLACLPRNNARIIRVCMRLHNFCIRMQQKDGGGRIGPAPEGGINPSDFDIDPFEGNPFGFLETGGVDEEDCVGQFDVDLDVGQDSNMRNLIRDSFADLVSYNVDSTLRDEFVDEIIDRQIKRPNHNLRRNREWDYDDDDSVESTHEEKEDRED